MSINSMRAQTVEPAEITQLLVKMRELGGKNSDFPPKVKTKEELEAEAEEKKAKEAQDAKGQKGKHASDVDVAVGLDKKRREANTTRFQHIAEATVPTLFPVQQDVAAALAAPVSLTPQPPVKAVDVFPPVPSVIDAKA